MGPYDFVWTIEKGTRSPGRTRTLFLVLTTHWICWADQSFLVPWIWRADISRWKWPLKTEQRRHLRPLMGSIYQFKVMPFGLCNAPATFQRLMDRVLGGLKWSSCLVYFDDIIIVGSTFDDHLRNIGSVLMRLRGAGLKLKPAKCIFCQQQVSFLGHVVSSRGISTDPSKTEVHF